MLIPIVAQYLNEKDVAAITGLSLSKLRSDRFKGIGMPYCKIGRAVRYKCTDVERFMDSKRVRTGHVRTPLQ